MIIKASMNTMLEIGRRRYFNFFLFLGKHFVCFQLSDFLIFDVELHIESLVNGWKLLENTMFCHRLGTFQVSHSSIIRKGTV